MILAPLTVSLSFAQVALKAVPSELERVKAFLQVASREASHSKLHTARLPEGEPRVQVDTERSWRTIYDFEDVSIEVDRRSSAVSSYNYDDPGLNGTKAPIDYVPPRRVSDAQALDIARRFYVATGEPYPIRFIGIEDGVGSFHENIMIGFVPLVNGIPYVNEESGWIGINRETGRVSEYNFHELSRDLPRPPAFVPPQVTADSARLTAFRTVLNRWSWMGGAREATYEPMRLAICEVPNPGDEAIPLNDFKARARARAHPHGGRLIYEGRYGGFIGREGKAVYPYRIVIDPYTGEEIRADDTSAGLGGAPHGVVRNEVKATTVPCLWRVAVGDGPWSAPVKAALTPTKARGFNPSITAFLTDGKAAFIVTYDPARNLLAFRSGDRKLTSLYRPGTGLSTLLKRKSKG